MAWGDSLQERADLGVLGLSLAVVQAVISLVNGCAQTLLVDAVLNEGQLACRQRHEPFR